MSELRWIILGIGILIIAAIYFWESWKHKRELRSRVDNFPGTTADSYDDIHISPRKEVRKEKEIDLSAAAAAFNSYLKKSRGKEDVAGSPAEETREPGSREEVTVEEEAVKDETIVVIYIVSSTASGFSGVDIQSALEEAGLQFGDMQIFHYRGAGEEFEQRALFSVANIHEPGTFEIDNMAAMTTDGLAMFMCLPAPIGGDIAFEMMLDCARNLADRLGGELRDKQHKLLDNDGINQLRQLAGKY